MARNSTLANLAQYALARGVLGFMQLLSVEFNLDVAARVGSLAYALSARRSARARANVQLAFPDMSPERVEEIVERSWQHMLQLFLVDALAAPKMMTTDGWARFVELHDLRETLDHFLHGRPAILITGHVGNWELCGSLMGLLGYPIYALARPIDNPLINRWLLEMREARGARIITKWGAVPIVQDILRNNGIVAFIADQNAGDRGLFVPFFGRLASSYKSIAVLAMRYRAPVIVGFTHRIGTGYRFRIEVTDFIRPDEWWTQPDPVFYITARYNRAIEQMVRATPEQYVWVHRRWKSRPRHERLGRPFPRKLRAKLEELPWMTQHELDRIIALSEAESARSEVRGQKSEVRSQRSEIRGQKSDRADL